MDIISTKGGYWVKDVSTQFPCFVNVTKKNPLIVRNGLVLWCGDFYEITLKQRETGGGKDLSDAQCVDIFYQREFTSQMQKLQQEEDETDDQVTYDFSMRKKSKAEQK